jgi:hypothetical protein
VIYLRHNPCYLHVYEEPIHNILHLPTTTAASALAFLGVLGNIGAAVSDSISRGLARHFSSSSRRVSVTG